MSSEFKIPLHRFDTNLLPPEARTVGSESFKTAVMLHFAAEYAAQGQMAIVTVDDSEITVQAFPAESTALVPFCRCCILASWPRRCRCSRA